jgi:hypothetical protein
MDNVPCRQALRGHHSFLRTSKLSAMEQPASNTPAASSTQASGPTAQQWRVLIDNPWALVAILFLVTAALGLPFLWMSRAFNVWAKLALSIAVLAWTALVLWVFYLIMAWCIPRIVEGLHALFA